MQGKLFTFEWEITECGADGWWVTIHHEGRVIRDEAIQNPNDGERMVLNVIKNRHMITIY